MRKAIQTFKTKAACTAARAGAILRDEAGDFYISDGVKIIIAVVLGALLLAALTCPPWEGVPLSFLWGWRL